jgi:hypothetical protein
MGWHWDNLTRESSSFGSAEAGALASHVFDAERTQHVFDRIGRLSRTEFHGAWVCRF